MGPGHKACLSKLSLFLDVMFIDGYYYFGSNKDSQYLEFNFG